MSTSLILVSVVSSESNNRKIHSCFRANGLKKQIELFVSQHSGLEKIVAAKALQQFFGDNKK